MYFYLFICLFFSRKSSMPLLPQKFTAPEESSCRMFSRKKNWVQPYAQKQRAHEIYSLGQKYNAHTHILKFKPCNSRPTTRLSKNEFSDTQAEPLDSYSNVHFYGYYSLRNSWSKFNFEDWTKWKIDVVSSQTYKKEEDQLKWWVSWILYKNSTLNILVTRGDNFEDK